MKPTLSIFIGTYMVYLITCGYISSNGYLVLSLQWLCSSFLSKSKLSFTFKSQKLKYSDCSFLVHQAYYSALTEARIQPNTARLPKGFKACLHLTRKSVIGSQCRAWPIVIRSYPSSIFFSWKFSHLKTTLGIFFYSTLVRQTSIIFWLRSVPYAYLKW